MRRLRALELMPADVARGQAAFRASGDEERVSVEQADICQAAFGEAAVDVVTILDVLH